MARTRRQQRAEQETRAHIAALRRFLDGIEHEFMEEPRAQQAVAELWQCLGRGHARDLDLDAAEEAQEAADARAGQQRPALADVMALVDQQRAAERLAARRSGVMPPSARGVQVVERGEHLMLGIPDEWGGTEVALAPHAWIEVLEQSWARWRQFSAPRIALEGPEA